MSSNQYGAGVCKDELTVKLLWLAAALDDDENPVAFDGNLVRDAALEIATLRQRLSEASSFALAQRTAETLDAERYRYLRSAAGQYAGDECGPMVCSGCGDNFEYLRAEEVDQEVDEAMAAWKAAGSPTFNSPPPVITLAAKPDDAVTERSPNNDPGCICRGNWRAIVKRAEPFLGKHFDGESHRWTFFGVVHGDDDYYYGMWREGEMKLLSCVGSIATHGYALADE